MPVLQASPKVQAASVSWQDSVHYFGGCWRFIAYLLCLTKW